MTLQVVERFCKSRPNNLIVHTYSTLKGHSTSRDIAFRTHPTTGLQLISFQRGCTLPVAALHHLRDGSKILDCAMAQSGVGSTNRASFRWGGAGPFVCFQVVEKQSGESECLNGLPSRGSASFLRLWDSLVLSRCPGNQPVGLQGAFASAGRVGSGGGGGHFGFGAPVGCRCSTMIRLPWALVLQ